MSFATFAMLLFMLIRSSSMFEFHMFVAVVVMFNILELIIELLPNFPIVDTPEPIPWSSWLLPASNEKRNLSSAQRMYLQRLSRIIHSFCERDIESLKVS